jgi:hypothetical protein
MRRMVGRILIMPGQARPVFPACGARLDGIDGSQVSRSLGIDQSGR